MTGSKATHLHEWAEKAGRAYCRFDYSGHGTSDGAFEDGVISAWAADARAVLDQLTEGPQILVGSSMGGWIAALLALARPERIAGIVFIAPAPDFTEKLMWPSFTQEERDTIMREGRLVQPSDYSDEPEVLTRALFDDGRNNLVMTGSVPIHAPIHILQGMNDDAVPWSHAMAFAQQLESKRIEITMTKTGDHRLSTDEDLKRLVEAVENLLTQ